MNLAPGQISLKYGMKGPNFSPVSACATGNHSIGDAMIYIERGMADVMVTGGAEATITPLGIGAAVILFFHFVMVYWLVLPYYGGQLPVAERPGLSPSIVDLFCLMAVGGLYFSLVFCRMTQHALIPIKDPRLSRSLHFVNA